MADFIGSWSPCAFRLTSRSRCRREVSVPCLPRPGGRHNVAQKAKTEFYYYINGKPYLLTPGKDGVTEEIITVLRESYHAERLNDRYEDEKQDPQFKHTTSLHATNPMHPEAPIDRLEDVSFAPEAQLFTEEIPPSLLDQMRDLIPPSYPPLSKNSSGNSVKGRNSSISPEKKVLPITPSEAVGQR